MLSAGVLLTERLMLEMSISTPMEVCEAAEGSTVAASV